MNLLVGSNWLLDIRLKTKSQQLITNLEAGFRQWDWAGFFKKTKVPRMEGKMRINKTLIILSVLLIWTTQAVSSIRVNLEPGGLTLNDVCGVTASTTAEFWAVGDSGLVMKIVERSAPGDIRIERRFRLLSGAYDFHGVSFATPSIGWIVGYKRNEPRKREGVILRTTDGGTTWTAQYPVIINGINIPFLEVHAVNERIVWVSCGNGYVMRSTDGGVSWHLTPSKPVRPNYMGWFWGIYAPGANEAWICSGKE